MSAPFEAGERVMLVDGKGRRYLVRLEGGGVFHYHGGTVLHDLIMGSAEGTVVHSASGSGLTCYRPRLADFVLKMPRGAQVIYPKDLGAILVYADVFPGARVLEAGTGSGALTLALCRAAGAEGLVVSYEIRPEFREKAETNLETFFGKLPEQLDLRSGDVREVAETGDTFDRVILDLPEPWETLAVLDVALLPGGILCAYLPTTVQVQTLVLALGAHGFQQVETSETMMRTWHVSARSVRPDHRMVGHTGFIVTARRASPAA